jgi:hypothetical protein
MDVSMRNLTQLNSLDQMEAFADFNSLQATSRRHQSLLAGGCSKKKKKAQKKKLKEASNKEATKKGRKEEARQLAPALNKEKKGWAHVDTIFKSRRLKKF